MRAADPRAPGAPGGRVRIRPPEPEDEAAFLARVRASRLLHGNWVRVPRTRDEYRQYLERAEGEYAPWPTHVCRLVVGRDDEGALLGVANLNNLVWGGLRAGSLGYYAFAPHAGRGYMREGVAALLTYAFREFGVHRAEAAIQPDNAASLALVRALGFRHEGTSPRYLMLGGRWRDHERWALHADEWRPARAVPGRGRPSGRLGRAERILGP